MSNDFELNAIQMNEYNKLYDMVKRTGIALGKVQRIILIGCIKKAVYYQTKHHWERLLNCTECWGFEDLRKEVEDNILNLVLVEETGVNARGGLVSFAEVNPNG